jgi:hypothetical protein
VQSPDQPALGEQMDNSPAPFGEAQGPLAEFSALRQEITTRIPLQHNVFIFQLTTTGGVFSFVLANWSLWPILFVLPITSYLFAPSYYELHRVMRQMAAYINTILSEKIPGGIHWEEWVQEDNAKEDQDERKENPGRTERDKAKSNVRKQRRHKIRTISPFLVAFPGPSILALSVLLFRLVRRNPFQPYRWALWAAWGAGVLLTLATIQIAVKLAEWPKNPPEED